MLPFELLRAGCSRLCVPRCRCGPCGTRNFVRSMNNLILLEMLRATCYKICLLQQPADSAEPGYLEVRATAWAHMLAMLLSGQRKGLSCSCSPACMVTRPAPPAAPPTTPCPESPWQPAARNGFSSPPVQPGPTDTPCPGPDPCPDRNGFAAPPSSTSACCCRPCTTPTPGCAPSAGPWSLGDTKGLGSSLGDAKGLRGSGEAGGRKGLGPGGTGSCTSVAATAAGALVPAPALALSIKGAC